MTPAPLLVASLIALALPGAAVAAGMLPAGALIGAALLWALAALLDAWLLWRTPVPQVQREAPASVPVGVECEVTLRLRQSGARTLRLDVHDMHPGGWPVRAQPRSLRLKPAREARLDYTLTPVTRGQFEFGPCALRVYSPLGWWRRRQRAGPGQGVKVYPNFAPWARYALVGLEQASRAMGAHLQRRRGEGTDFEQLREYRQGDTLRQIDWKATQRMGKLVSREYQSERNQQVMLILDSGRRMLARDGLLSHFDRALDAALMVSYIALRQGDAVGLLTAGSETRFVTPQRGLGTVHVLLNALFDLQAEPVATDYPGAVETLLTRQSRRCLVLMVTNARDEDLEELVAAVHQLKRRHLVCVASLREQVIADVLAQPVRELRDAVEVAAMADYAERREQAHARLRAQRVDVLDVSCAQLPGALVNHYLLLKRATLL